MEKRKRTEDVFKDLLREMQNEFDRTFEEVFEGPMWDAERCCLEPLVDVDEHADVIIVTVDLPLVKKKEDVEIQLVEDDRMIVMAKMEKGICFDRWGSIQRSICFTGYHKEILLPSKVKIKGISAILKRGLLRVKLPKKVETFHIAIE